MENYWLLAEERMLDGDYEMLNENQQIAVRAYEADLTIANQVAIAAKEANERFMGLPVLPFSNRFIQAANLLRDAFFFADGVKDVELRTSSLLLAAEVYNEHRVVARKIKLDLG